MLLVLRLTSGLVEYNNTKVYVVTCRLETITASNFDAVSSNVAVRGVINAEILTSNIHKHITQGDLCITDTLIHINNDNLIAIRYD